MEWAFSRGPVSAFPQGLADDGHDLPIGLLFDSARPDPKTTLKFKRLDLSEDSRERVVGRHPMLKRKQLAKPSEFRLAELGMDTKSSAPLMALQIARSRISLGWTQRVARMAWVFNLGKAIEQRGLGHRSQAVRSKSKCPET
jgi:hypothetical protein